MVLMLILFRSGVYMCTICKTQNSEILPELTDKSNEQCAEARELASQISFKNSKSSEEATKQPFDETSSTNGLTRRNVPINEETQSSANLENIVNRSSSFTPTAPTVMPQQPPKTSPTASNNPAQQQISSQRQTLDKILLILIIIFGVFFAFLFLRRIYLIVDNESFPV
jgi:cobalamin biosynthesis Mg chelatase CobN